MEPRDLIVLTPPGDASSLAIAASRAGALGVIDLEHIDRADPLNEPRTLAAIEPVARYAGSRFGVLIRSTHSQSLSQTTKETDRIAAAVLACKPSHVILAGGASSELIRHFIEASVKVLVEAVSLEEARAGVEAGASGIILKGHEAGGRVGRDTSFVLLQKWLHYANSPPPSGRGVGGEGLLQHAKKSSPHSTPLPEREGRTLLSPVPVWVRGGIGPHSAAACMAAGAAGVVLDSQVLAARESPLTDDARKRIAGLDGSETIVLGGRLGECYRLYSRADSPAVKDLLRVEEELQEVASPFDEKLRTWREAVRSRIASDPVRGVWPVGQDVAISTDLAREGVTVAGIIQALVAKVAKLASAAERLHPLAMGSPLAQAHGTEYPILQGPMTRVSDTAEFAEAVAAGGGLPFLALALLRKAETEQLLAKTKARLGRKPWGVGILGFVPAEIRAEQLEAIRAHKPPFAIIAGGRPDQARELEAIGIPTYLHVPSPGLLRRFLKDGSRRFIFEGQECGGHIGPHASFPLWETMVGVIEDHLAGKRGEDLHVVFAGGIHDELSARMVAALSAGLAEKGVKVGVLIGTAYLFTREAVECGAITAKFQQEALACGDTVLLETGPGHAIRCIPTPYAETFEVEKRALRAAGKSPLEIGIALERMNLGRLRVASKGVDRAAGGLVPVSEEEQQRKGMYMIGQIAALRGEITTIAQLHAEVCGANADSSAILIPPAPVLTEPAPPPCDVAIIGLSCFYPKAGGLWPYWENILDKVNGVIEVPPTHWDWKPFYDPDPRARDKSVSKWGGFMDDIVFDPLTFGITPKSIPCIEPLQLILLEGVRQAVADAGYSERPFARERTAAILGVGGGGMPLSVAYGFRACMPLLDSIPDVPVKSSEVVALGDGILPEWTEDSFPGILLNVAAGRVANRFNLGGPNMAIDAACGSSLAALYAGVRELNDGTSDVAIVMGADAVQTPFAYVAFSKTHALSPKGRCRPFDAAADGIVLAEGVGVAVLKRLADAERDGDRIYAVIKGVGASSDGRDKGLTAPRAEGQLRALRRAYAQARVSPARVGLVEAHGTGTVVGDQTESQALGQVFREAGGNPQSCALGSVKSMIGHSKCAAGLAGLIKTALALHHKVLPPTLVETPNPKGNFEAGPLFLNTQPRPWVHGPDHPRTAGVSAFGFGGTNFHTVLEEYTGDYLHRPAAGFRRWSAELFVWRRPEVAALQQGVSQCLKAIQAGAQPGLADLAASVWQSSRAGTGMPTLAIVAASLDDLQEKLKLAAEILDKKLDAHTDPRGVYFARQPAGGKVAFLFPGQGSQYPDMLAQAAMAFPELREVLDGAERTLAGKFDRPLGKYIYPPSAFTPADEQRNKTELTRTEIAQPALGAVSLGMARVLAAMGIEPDFLAGHSYGEYVALAAAGAMSEADLVAISHQRGLVLKEAAAAAGGGMTAVDAPAATVAPVLAGIDKAWIANHNSSQQTVIAGTEAGLEAAAAKLQTAGLRCQRIPVACAFHTPLIAGARGPLARALAGIRLSAPHKPVFSNTTASPHGTEPEAIARQLVEHINAPVRFADEIEAMYEAGARVFVEVGPHAVLTGLVGQILAGKPHLAAASDLKNRPGLVQLAHFIGQVLVAGVPAQLDRLFQGRGLQPFDLAKLGPDSGKLKAPATAWVINGVRSRPINGPEPRLLGQPLPAKSVDRSAGAGDRKKVEPAGNGATIAPQANGKRMPNTVETAKAENASRLSSIAHSSIAHSPAVPRAPSAIPPAAPTSMNQPEALPIPPAGTAPEGAAQVMMRFQEVMSRFLDTQKSVMLSFLGTPAPTAAPSRNGNGHGLPLPATSTAVVNRLPEAARPGPAPTPKLNGENGHAHRHAGAGSNGSNGSNGKHSHPEPAAPETAAKDEPVSHDTLLAKLLDLVSERTGYPKEALSIDLDLEADLGIDSIKRVEILGTLAETLQASATGKAPNLEMEKLSVLKTLRGIADYVSAAMAETEASPSAAAAPAAKAPAAHPGAREGEVQRLVVRLVDSPLPLRPRFAPPTGAILLTDDRRGCARDLADRLAELDVNVALIRMGDGASTAGGTFEADLTSPEAVNDLLERIRDKCGPIAGLIHLLPLAEPEKEETPEDRIEREVKSLYLLSRGLESDLREAGKTGSAVLLSVTSLGGAMGFGRGIPDSFFAGHGGIAGFTKCLGYEWPEVTVRVVDVDGETPAPQLTELLMGELGDPDGPFEVGRTPDRRVTWQCEPGPLAQDQPLAQLASADAVLITGGARGITARVARELARRFQCRLVLVGSSPLPSEEPEETAKLTRPAEIKAALLKRLSEEGKQAAPAAAEAAYKRLMKDREIRANLEAIREAGSVVDYRAVDVRDAAAFGAVIDELTAAGGIAGVIHGAGVIEDKLLRDKTPESFDRVLGTKVSSAFTLVRKLRPEPLKFFALFASITSRYGNRGQSDYAAANEVLSKLAANLDRNWPGRVVSIAWGPWAEVGMVADLEKHLVARGLKLIQPDQGAAFAVDEVIYGGKGEPEVLIAGGAESPARPSRNGKAETAPPAAVR